jgi:hypothetical protein
MLSPIFLWLKDWRTEVGLTTHPPIPSTYPFTEGLTTHSSILSPILSPTLSLKDWRTDYSPTYEYLPILSPILWLTDWLLPILLWLKDWRTNWRTNEAGIGKHAKHADGREFEVACEACIENRPFLRRRPMLSPILLWLMDWRTEGLTTTYPPMT